jgi:pimeloyl-ACP methyl ester carboxylesterase
MINMLVSVLDHLEITDDVITVCHSWGAMLLAAYFVRRTPACVKHLAPGGPRGPDVGVWGLLTAEESFL